MNSINAPEGATRSRKRLGRGPASGTGKTSGKGHKGQNARSGGGVRPGFEGGQMPLYRRIARRGFSNYPFKVEYLPVNLDRLANRFESGDTVDLASLKEHGLVSRNATHVKILARGECDRVLHVVGLKVSAGARAKIEAAGGSVTGEPGAVEEPAAPAAKKKGGKAAAAPAAEEKAPAAETPVADAAPEKAPATDEKSKGATKAKAKKASTAETDAHEADSAGETAADAAGESSEESADTGDTEG